jgi:aspartokinase/homoserine dehydrogenase 1
VAANKKANTMDFNFYREIENIVENSHVNFKYETNVGAGLPVISTINSLIESGDKILKIEGVFSGTLSYLFNNFDGSISFSNLVKSAKENGYTEPDPRDDLNGMDVAKKLLILARKIGLNMELNDVQTESLLPEKSEEISSIPEFLNYFEAVNLKFESLLKTAQQQNKKLCYIGSLQDGRAKVQLEMIPKNHPFYNLDGSENIVSIQTERYFDKPLVIRGHGAGAEVTAGGIMADIMSIVETI